jgi:hypothetical protein
MHPPFGFALFYLRSVAPNSDYKDKVTGQQVAKVTTGQIYWGSVPFVIIQVIMVSLIIAFPGIVSRGDDEGEKLDADKVLQEMDMRTDEEKAVPPLDAASEPDAAASGAETMAEDDPMKALEEAVQKDAEEGKK